MHTETALGETLRLDSLFHALGDEHRLRILVSLYLADPEEEFRAEDLVAVGEDPDELVSTLYHAHFPKLADLGLIEWNSEERAVRRGPKFRAVDEVLDCLVVRDDEIQAGLLNHEM